eukprot:CAMPEP_0184390506 /NCGR_PEP_ID=MMETSP0007-20130409/13360_1 /TAXON_ID=97485 /ORGANISM="Prymnesium parvum, Strain Texoma1" /LENGTH=45 /DNA_ID= /DNA_START= /DNA_END= /DNA_ORIENTATION=
MAQSTGYNPIRLRSQTTSIPQRISSVPMPFRRTSTRELHAFARSW